ncbi:MAG TPA: arginine--tRNA ligase [Stellaceae bacterium]|nr:arginine--tRNA ligase [Stellaceae bacterium]
MNLFTYFRDAFLREIAVLFPGVDAAAVTVEPTRDPRHGDIATNAAMVLAKPAGKKPREIAERLAERLRLLPDVEGVEIAGPGFLNLRLAPRFWYARLADVLKAGPAYGDRASSGEVINVEYVSANPTGPMHVGHGRGAVVGDALAALLEKAGAFVTREYYINDAGAQVDVLARSAYLRYREALGEAIGAIADGLYPGEYLKATGEALAKDHGAKWRDVPENLWLPPIRDFAVAQMLTLIREDLALLGIHHEVFRSEREILQSGAIDRVCASLEKAGFLYTGVLEPPKGMLPDDWEARPQTLFRATQFGDDIDRPLRKSDGSWTYFAADIAYHLDKVQRGFAVLIDVWGADHGGYVKRMQAAVKALTGGAAVLDVKLCQLVNLFDQGVMVRMSKRAGTFVTLREVIERVGKDVFRFMMLTRRNDQALDFDFAKVTEQSKDNPVFYVQYAHARARSVLRHAEASGLTVASDLTPLTDPSELALIRKLSSWPRIVEGAAEAHEPHRIAFYLQELAADFHGLWNKGKDEASLRFILADAPSLSRARLALVQGVAHVIASGLKVMGVEPVEEMRG